MNSSRCPRILRKCTLKIFWREAKVSNDVEDFLPRILQHFRNRSLAKVQAVIRALLDRYELLQTIHRSQSTHTTPW